MITIMFGLLMFAVFGKLCWFALQACWGITKIFFSIIFLPVILIGMVIAGAIHLAFPLLIIIGIIVLISGKLA